jgi:hypothetical protein
MMIQAWFEPHILSQSRSHERASRGRLVDLPYDRMLEYGRVRGVSNRVLLVVGFLSRVRPKGN